MSKEKVNVTFLEYPELTQKLKVACAEQGIPMRDVFHTAILSFLGLEEPEPGVFQPMEEGE